MNSSPTESNMTPQIEWLTWKENNTNQLLPSGKPIMINWLMTGSTYSSSLYHSSPDIAPYSVWSKHKRRIRATLVRPETETPVSPEGWRVVCSRRIPGPGQRKGSSPADQQSAGTGARRAVPFVQATPVTGEAVTVRSARFVPPCGPWTEAAESGFAFCRPLLWQIPTSHWLPSAKCQVPTADQGLPSVQSAAHMQCRDE
jgi:hypothetical protein